MMHTPKRYHILNSTITLRPSLFAPDGTKLAEFYSQQTAAAVCDMLNLSAAELFIRDYHADNTEI